MKVIKITEKGWENYTGNLGGVDFIEGVSVREATTMEINRIGANLRIESVDSDQQLSPVTGRSLYFDEITKEIVSEIIEHEEATVTEATDGKPVATYSREQLEAIADKGGIAELRKISDELGVKGKSILTLIDGILKV